MGGINLFRVSLRNRLPGPFS